MKLRHWPRRRWWKIAAVALLGILVVLCLLPLVARPFVRARIEAALHDQFDGEVRIGLVGYWPPYTITARSLRLIAKDPSGRSFDLLRAKRASVTLSELSFRKPTTIQRIDLDAPQFHLMRAAGHELLGLRAAPTSRPARTRPRLRNLPEIKIHDATVAYDDGEAATLVWRNIDADFAAIAESPAEYSVQLSGGGAKTGTILARARLDFERLRVQLDRCDIQISLDRPDGDSTMPARARELLRRYQCAGDVEIHAKGEGPMDRNILDKLTAEVRVNPKQLRIQPDGFSAPLQDFAEATIEMAGGLATLRSLQFKCRGDSLTVDQAVASLHELPTAIELTDLRGSAIMAGDTPEHTGRMEQWRNWADLRGTVALRGAASIRFSSGTPELDYQLNLTVERGQALAVHRRIVMDNFNAVAIVTPRAAQVERLDAETLSGGVSARGRVELHSGYAFAGQAHISRVELNQLAASVSKPNEQPIEVSGLISGDFDFGGNAAGDARLDVLKSEGRVRIADANLFHVPVLKQIADLVQLKGAVTASEAHCKFALAERRFKLTNVEINSPTVGLSGEGSVALDGKLDFRVVATILGNLDERLRHMKTPVTDVAGRVVKAIEKGVNGVTGALLYRLHVTGDVSKPDVTFIAAPVLQRR